MIGHQSGYYAYAITSEGSQYKYYQGVTESWNNISTSRTKEISESGGKYWWWLRSTYYNNNVYFCGVSNSGNVYTTYSASNSGGVAPGFSI